MKFNKEIFWKVLEFPKNIYPKNLRKFADPETFYIEKMLESIGAADNGKIALDCGAGTQNKKPFIIKKNYIYESSDFENIFDKKSKVKQTYICSVENMPMKDKSYDLIISVQVLEHVKHPFEALIEMQRVLKKDGYLFLSTNFLYPRHGEPYDFFRFTMDGLRSIFDEAGFQIISIDSHGGFFAMISQFFHEIPLYFRNFIIFGLSHPHSKDFPVKARLPFLFLMLIPIFFINFLTQFFSLIFHLLDKFDTTKRYSLGYSVKAQRND